MQNFNNPNCANRILGRASDNPQIIKMILSLMQFVLVLVILTNIVIAEVISHIIQSSFQYFDFSTITLAQLLEVRSININFLSYCNKMILTQCIILQFKKRKPRTAFAFNQRKLVPAEANCLVSTSIQRQKIANNSTMVDASTTTTTSRLRMTVKTNVSATESADIRN